LKWIKKYYAPQKRIFEVGSGSGLIKKIINNNVITSDIKKNPFIDLIFDIDKSIIPKKFINYFDIIIFNHSLHHSKNPIEAIKKVKSMLVNNGLIIINEPETSIIFKLFLLIFKHERYDDNKKNNKNFWFENNSTGKILFQKKRVNDFFLKDFRILENRLSEFLIFLNSGGGGVDAPHIKLNFFLLEIIDSFDNFLIKYFPGLFALNRTIIMSKIK
jgi:SAM-dependent methyltransferase